MSYRSWSALHIAHTDNHWCFARPVINDVGYNVEFSTVVYVRTVAVPSSSRSAFCAVEISFPSKAGRTRRPGTRGLQLQGCRGRRRGGARYAPPAGELATRGGKAGTAGRRRQRQRNPRTTMTDCGAPER